MKEHIEQTVRDITAQIARLQDLIGALRRFGETGTAAVAAAGNGAERAQLDTGMEKPRRNAKARRTQRSAGVTTRRRGGAGAVKSNCRPKGIGLKVAAVLPRMPDEFTGDQVREALFEQGVRLTTAQIFPCLRGMARAGKLRVMVRGGSHKPSVYMLPKRQSRVSATAAEPAKGGRVSIPGLDDPPEQSLKEKLDLALRERDRARSEGQHTLVKIMQDKVDRLKGQMVAAGSEA